MSNSKKEPLVKIYTEADMLGHVGTRNDWLALTAQDLRGVANDLIQGEIERSREGGDYSPTAMLAAATLFVASGIYEAARTKESPQR